MSIIREKDRELIRERFRELENPVTILNFSQEFECQFCQETRGIMEEVAALSDKITTTVYDFQKDRREAERYRIDKIPATVVLGEKDYGIRFFGVPSGYEFVTLLDDIGMVSRGDSGLTQESRKKLASVSKPIHIQVFVTPT